MRPIIAEAEHALAICLQTRPVLPIVTKVIRLDFLQRKFDEFFNNRQDRPLFKLLLDNVGDNSFIDVGFIDPYTYTSIGRSDVGQLSHGYYFNDINSSKISLNFDMVQPAQLTFRIDFETGGGIEMPTSSISFHDMDFIEFFIAIKATFVADSRGIDLLNWVNAVENTSDDDVKDSLIEQFINIHIVTAAARDPGGVPSNKRWQNGWVCTKLCGTSWRTERGQHYGIPYSAQRMDV